MTRIFIGGSLSFSYGIEYFVKNFTEHLMTIHSMALSHLGLSTAFSRCVGRFEKYRRCEQKKKMFGREIDQIPFPVILRFPSPQQDLRHGDAPLGDIEVPLVDAPLQQCAAVQRHQILHCHVAVIPGIDKAVPAAQLHQLQQHTEVDAVLGCAARHLAPDTSWRG